MTAAATTRTLASVQVRGALDVYELRVEGILDPLQVKVLVACAALGSKSEAARYFEVARSQPGRWLRGAERPNPRARRLIQDLDYVWDRLTDERTPDAASIWLRSPNTFLDGATPLDWLKRRGPERVVAAVDAEEAGSYA